MGFALAVVVGPTDAELHRSGAPFGILLLPAALGPARGIRPVRVFFRGWLFQ